MTPLQLVKNLKRKEIIDSKVKYKKKENMVT